MFIITNTIEGDEYIPSRAENMEEAFDWMRECTLDNVFKAWPELSKQFIKDHNLEGNTMLHALVKNDAVEDFLQFMRDEGIQVSLEETSSLVVYEDDNYNMMHIYNCDEL